MNSNYATINSDLRRSLSNDANAEELIRYATMASSGHNTQPWNFEIQDQKIEITPDFKRRTPVVDPDNHHLYASLGCAAENLSLAAQAQGKSGEVLFDSTGDGAIIVDLRPMESNQQSSSISKLANAIPQRQVSRAIYEDRNVPSKILEDLQKAGNHCDVQTILITDKDAVEDLLDLIIAGNSLQMDDPKFVKELKHWIRFNANTISSKRDGIYSASTGNPSAPNWLGQRIYDFVVNKKTENKKCIKQVHSSFGLMVFVAKTNDKQGWINAGRAYERFALQATVAGLKHAFVNQATEVTQVRTQVKALLGIGKQRPNLIVRFGYGPTMPMSLRRPVKSVLIKTP